MSGGNGDRKQSLLRRLPPVDAVVDHDDLSEAVRALGRGIVTHHVRHTIDELRTVILSAPDAAPETDLDCVAQHAHRRLRRHDPLPRILNGTGVILHSGLGRAPLSDVARDAVTRAGAYSLLEVDRARGDRLARDSRASELLCALTGADAALVVNNNAAATLLILTALAQGKEVVCSRGEMVEIGGSFRIPEVMEASGAELVAVGATNITRLSDYENAITERTGALLVVHTSNYRILGFTGAPTIAEISALAHRHDLPMVHDVGSGSLLSPEELGLGDEPPVGKSILDGADVVCMSGDKLLGGPQAGIILGKRTYVDHMRKHPLARALRVDKMTIAALEATLALFLDAETLRDRHAVTRMLTLSQDDLRPRAEAFAAIIREHGPTDAAPAVIDTTSETGSGALPTLQIPSVAVAVDSPVGPDRLARALREQDPGVFSRIQDDRVCLDLRTLLPGEEEQAARIVADVLTTLTS